MMLDPHGPAGLALTSLSQAQVDFIQSLPKAELHAHLNGCIPLATLQSLARDMDPLAEGHPSIKDVLTELAAGVDLDKIDSFFDLFPAIYAITSNPRSLRIATSAVLDSFLQPTNPSQPSQCSYIELRTTPRATPFMSRREYLLSVLEEIQPRGPAAALIVSLDRRMKLEVAQECAELAIELRDQGYPVVGVDLCGNPLEGDMKSFRDIAKRIQSSGLGLTLHISETKDNYDVKELLSWEPGRLGHATFLDEDDISLVARRRTPIEICISSNLLCKTVAHLADHHLNAWLERDHPLIICTDDTLPFRTTLLGEYALLLAAPPLGLGLTEDAVVQLAKYGFESRFQ